MVPHKNHQVHDLDILLKALSYIFWTTFVKKAVAFQNLNRQKRVIGRIRNAFFRKDPVSALSSAPPVALYEFAAEQVDSRTAKSSSMRLKRDNGASQMPSRRHTLDYDTWSSGEDSSPAPFDPQPAGKKRCAPKREAFPKDKHQQRKRLIICSVTAFQGR